jgi:pimeloyl-ACP methyl ester carboxylesterase
MSIIKELSEDFKYAHAVMFEHAKSEFEFKGKNGPIIAIHGLGGGWAEKGFRKYMTENNVCGVLVYFGEITDGLNKYIDRLNTYLDKYSNPVIVGFSAGGIIALKYAEKYGWDKFKKIITVGTPLFGSPHASKLTFLGETFKELSVGSDYLNQVRSINPPNGKGVLSIFSDGDLKAPFKNVQTLNWPVLLLEDSPSHGEIHSNFKILEQIINKEIGMVSKACH